MTATKTSKRLSRVAKDLNVATTTIREYLEKKGIEISSNPNARLSNETYEILLEKFQPDKLAKEKAEQVVLPGSEKKEEKAEKQEKEPQAAQDSPVAPSNEEAVETEKQEEKTTPETASQEESSHDQQSNEPEVKQTEEEADTEKETSESSSEGKEEQQAEEASPSEESQTEETTSQEQSTETESQNGPKFLGKIDLDQVEETKPKGKSKKQKSTKSQTKSSKQTEKPSDKEEPQKEETSPSETASKQEKQAPLAEDAQSSEEQSSEVSGNETQQASSEEETAPKEESSSTEEAKTAEDEETKEESDAKTKESEAAAPDDQKAESSESLSKKEDYDLKGPTVVGKIDLSEVKSNKPKKKEPVASTSDLSTTRKKRRKRKPVKGEETTQKGEEKQQKDTKKTASQSQSTEKQKDQRKKKGKKKTKEKEEIDSGQVQEQLKETLNKLSGGKSGGSRSKFRKKKRDEERQKEEARQEEIAESEKNKLQVTEFITVNELANLMDVQVTELIGTCLNLGIMVSMNQRIDAETITILADEYGYDVEFTEAEMDEPSLEEEDDPDNYIQKPPVVSIMGHVDHGKTSLLDYIQGSKIIAGESGGITQHIGAYEITLQNERNITFLDTPGHEAFTAMRARGAKATDIAVIIIAADDDIKPQTKEAISHAQAAEVPMIFAINKVDKEGASPDRIRQQLAEMNILVEEWGGKYQSQEISAKHGENVDELLEKVLLESDLLELKADSEKRAVGSVVEAWLDKGKGYVTNLLVEGGTLRVGDPVLAGSNMARIRAMMDERGNRVEAAKPGTPVQVLGFDGAPQAGERFYVTQDEQTAKEIANERKQLIREQGIRATKHVTLDELGRRLAIGNFQELKVVIKGDVDGSVEAIADSLQKLSTEEIQVRVIHKGVGQISESDVLLASASDAIILGFQVRPSSNARRLAEQEQIDLRMYSVIYDAVQEVKSAMEGMLTPSVEENVVGNVEVRQVFKVSKVGTVAGCKVTSGKITRNAKVRVIRDGVVIHTGEIDTLKRYKDDVKEVASGYECGLNIKNFNDIVEGDYLEVYEEVEVKRSLN
jgi:translation initiation factor IF-2